MLRRLFLAVLITVFFSVSGLGSLTLLEMPRETPLYHPPNSWSFKFAFANDSIGVDHYDEWDDGRTSALELVVKTPLPLYFEMAHSIMTKRNTAAAPASEARTDSLHMVAGLELEGDVFGGRGRLMAGVGGLFYGNFLGFTLQNGVHILVNQPRPIPPASSYDPPAAGFLFSGETGLTSPWGTPFAATFTYAASSLGYWELSPGLGFILASPYGHARVDLRYQFLDVGSVPSTASSAYSPQEGLWVDATFSVHAFSVNYSLKPGTPISQGAFFINISEGTLAFQNALWKGDYRQDLSFVLGKLGYVHRNAWTPTSWKIDGHAFALVMDIHSGFTESYTDVARYQKNLLGAEWYYTIGRKVIFEPFASLAIGYTYAKDYEDLSGGSAAEVRTETWAFLGRVSTGVRFSPILTPKRARNLRYGFTAGVIFDFDSRMVYKGNIKAYLGATFRDEGLGGGR